MTIRFAHTNIVARDHRRLVEFYVSVFECVPIPPSRDIAGEWLARGTGVPGAHLRGMHLRLPGHGHNAPTLEIFEYADSIPSPRPDVANREGIRHLAFEVDDVDMVAQRVVAAGGALIGEVVTELVHGVGRLTFVYAADPEGNHIEIQHWDRGARGARSQPGPQSEQAV